MRHLIHVFSCLLVCLQFHVTLQAQSCVDPAACNFDPNSGEPASVCLEIESFAVHTEGDLAGLTTYRLYLQATDSADFVTAVYGNQEEPLSLTTTTNFYHHPLGGSSAEAVNPLLLGVYPELEFDSYVTIGLDRKAVSGAGENAASLIASPDQDWISVFDPGAGALGSDIVIDDEIGGIWFIYNGDSNGAAGAEGRVLLAQLTTDGVLGGALNVQYFPAGGEASTVTFTLDAPCVPSNGDDCVYADPGLDCAGNCINDLDEDQICDEDDDCVGTPDALGVCNGSCTADINNNGICDDLEDCLGAPTLSSGAPTSGLSCVGGELIQLSGTNLCDATVTVDGASVAVVNSTPSQVSFSMPVGAGSVSVLVTTPSGTSNALNLTYASPALSSGTPTSGLSCVGGELIQLSGTNLCDATVTVNGASVAVVNGTPSQVSFSMPVGAGSASVLVTTPSGTSNAFTLTYASPTLSSGTPTSGLSCVGGELIELSGTNLCDAAVTVDGASVAVVHGTPSQVSFSMPAGTGSVSVLVTTPSGTSNALTLTYGTSGCLDPTACNFDATAECDGGGCLYLDAIGDCGGDCSADNDDNGICDDQEGSGCADEAACNFDPFAEPVDTEPISDYCLLTEAVVVHSSGDLAGMTTYQVSIQTLNNSDFVTSVSGNIDAPTTVATTTSFYQHILGGVTPQNVNPLLLDNFPNLAFDSWVTIGLDGPADAIQGENSAAVVNSPGQNWGLVFDPGSGADGSDLIINDNVGGVWYILNGDANGFPDENGRVLLGQFTTDGVLSGNMQVQVFPNGDNENFVLLDLPLGLGVGCPTGGGDCLYDDALGNCGGDCTADVDNDGICDDVDPCVGAVDACGVCNGPGAVYDCGCDPIAAGDCDCDGNEEDALGICGGDCTDDADEDGICDDVDDCVGTLDACGICNGPGATGDCGCDDIPDGECDCNGNVLDAIGVCGGTCTVDADGDGLCDDEDPCVGDLDACGVCNGPGAVYACGCDEIVQGACDCDGNVEDAIGVCGGNCSADVNNNGICDDTEEAGCDDEDACNYDANALPYTPPVVDEGYCLELRTLAEHTEGELAGQTTYQILLHTENASDFVTSVYGNINEALAIETSTSFYQHILGGVTPENVNPLLLGNYPNLAFDSWVTIGLDGPANASNGENGAATVQSPGQAWSTLFEPGSGAPGGSIVMDDEVGGVWYVLNGDANGTPSADGTVLLGQFTTDGDVTGNMNIQVFPEGDNENFVKVNLPIGGSCVAVSVNPACVYPDGDDVDCDGVCYNDADEDGVCDEQEIAGCQDELACNYNPLATDDDGSCLALDVCGECGGSGIPDGECDCNGNVEDAIGDCGGDCEADADNDGICDDEDPCVGALDACGICNGPGAIYDCGCLDIADGECDCDGNVEDAIGLCGGDCTSDEDNDGICDDVDPCVGALDACGVCNGPGAVYECGCADVAADACDCDGNVEDAIGDCGGDCAADADNDGICDDEDPCVGDLDACGVCNGPGAVYDCGCEDIADGECDCDGNVEDALGDCGGDCAADEDNDGICDDVDPCVGALDACGVCNGPGAVYDCGCEGIANGACDCDGNVEDALGICGGDCVSDVDNDNVCDSDEIPGCTNENACNYNALATDEDGSCAVLDALGECGGSCPADLNEDGICDNDNVFGCTDEAACNFNPSADVNNGSCEFFSCVGCTDSDAINYDAGATVDDGNCSFAGCTDADAENFDIGADVDDGSCVLLGCTDPTACNYDAAANTNDASACEFDCYGCINLSACNFDNDATVDDGTCEFTSCRGCTDPDAVNYDFTALIDDNSCLYEGCTNVNATNFDPNADLNDGSCIFPGCNNPEACNYDQTATIDDGSCDLTSCLGCMNPFACNFDVLATISSGDCDLYSCRGCTDEDAFNYDEDATIDNNSCLYTGCIDPEADNYDANADYSDGSCYYVGCTNQFACNFDITATVSSEDCDLTSCYGCTNPLACDFDSTATISDGSCDLLTCRGCTNPAAVNYDDQASIDDGSCVVVGCKDPAADNYDPTATYNDVSLCTYSPVEGCIIIQACNYNASATVSDGSCNFDCYGCNDPAANNYDPSATLSDGSCTYGMSTGNMAMLNGCTLPFACNYLDTENPCEFDSCSGCLDPGACNYDPDATLATTCFTPEDLCNGATNVDCDCNCINDANQNGVCDENETGGCTDPLSCNYSSAAAFDDGSCETESCGGCTDSTACNYDASATLNNGSCDYQTCTGCTDATACNYAANATVSDGSCTYAGANVDCNGDCLNDVNQNGTCDELETEGCTDAFACNYDAQASIDDGSCENVSCAGCTDDSACNYDADALVNDGSCDYESCLGCTDAGACNYDSGAAQNDGSCTYPANAYVDCNGECLQDVNQNGVCDPLEIPGCTDGAACNYDPEATDDDGACDFASCVGCLDAAACNYDALATQSSGACDYVSCVGCTEATACNYNASATQSNGSCIYPVGLLYDCDGDCVNDADGNGVCDELEILGCTNSGACNYEPLATNNDGSCDFASCAGCTLPSACNYDAQATQDDGSCDLSGCLGCTYADALNYDATATLDDGGCIYDCGGSGNDACPADLTDDGVIGVADLLEFLIYFDTSCIAD